MRNEKQVQSAAVLIHNWLLMVTYMGKSTLAHDRHEERLKLVVTSPAKYFPQEYMYTFEVDSLAPYKIENAKDFKTLKEFYYFLKFNGESIRFREAKGQGLLSVQYLTTRKQKLVIHIENGKRFVVQGKQARKNRVETIEQQERIAQDALEELARDPEVPPYVDEDTLLVQKGSDILSKDDSLTQQAKRAKKIVIRFCQMDVNSPQCEMKNDRQIDRMVIKKIQDKLPQLKELRELNIQWYKLSTIKAIQQLITACKPLENLRVLTFDNQGNAFDKSCFKLINQNKWSDLQQITCFFNISDQDDYYEESWWHPEHTEKYKGKEPIEAQEWEHFAMAHKHLNSVWIPKNGERDITLLRLRPWKKLALGYYDDQEMNEEYWTQMHTIFTKQISPEKHYLTSLCLTRIKNIKDEALAAVIDANYRTLECFTMNWCDNESDNGLRPLENCGQLKSLCLRHSPLQDNKKVACRFLASPNLQNLQSLCIQNFKQAYDAVFGFLASKQSSKLRSLSLPRNQWVNIELLQHLRDRGGHEGLIKLNLYNSKLPKETDQVIKIISNLQHMRVLNLGVTQLELTHIKEMIAPLKHLRKLNISDRKTSKNMNRSFYDEFWRTLQYPVDENNSKKPYEKLESHEKKQFVARLSNLDVTEILKLIPRVTHLDIRNLGGDERPFADYKLVPNLRFVGCQFELYKLIQALDRRGITFV